MSTTINKESKVIDQDIIDLLIENETQRLKSIMFTTDNLQTTGMTLPYDSASALAYAEQYCANGNNCPDGQFPVDCTHFLAHCLAAGGLKITSSSQACSEGLCVRAIDLAAAFSNSIGKISNIKRINNHAETRRGDYCFVPSWFDSPETHAMLLAGPADADKAMVYAHSKNLCNERVDFKGAACVYYRIEDA